MKISSNLILEIEKNEPMWVSVDPDRSEELIFFYYYKYFIYTANVGRQHTAEDKNLTVSCLLSFVYSLKLRLGTRNV